MVRACEAIQARLVATLSIVRELKVRVYGNIAVATYKDTYDIQFKGEAWPRFCAMIEGRLGLWGYSFGDHAPISPGEGTVQSANFEFSVPLRRA
jgi:hypothetical protein